MNSQEGGSAVPKPEPSTQTIHFTMAPGSLLSGRYQLTRELGRGGFGIVYLAHDTQLHNRAVVIKILLEQRSDEWSQRKFKQECEALARIDHPGIVGVKDQGLTPAGHAFLALEFVNGVTLRTLLEAGAMDLHRAARLLRQMARALSAAHDAGVCHRDLKPENVMVRDLGGGEEQAVIIDFGIATVANSDLGGDAATRLAGSPRYMAPEQLKGKPVAASDIFSLGVITYEMITRHLPFRCDSAVELFLKQKEALAKKPRELRPDLPAPAERAILRALSFNASDRYPRADDFGAEFYGSIESPPARQGPLVPAALEMASVLFMDIVSYSLAPMEQQIAILERLQSLVRSTEEYAQSESQGELICLPTGDGMALVFFGDPTAAVRCALHINREARLHPELSLRMGVHTGPVYRIADINANRNVAGGGINMAQRVMDAGDAGHILVSAAVGETLRQLGGWDDRLFDLGQREVKHGVSIHFFNLCAEDAGNRATPSKWLKAPPPRPSSRRGLLAGAIVAVALSAGGIYIALQKKEPPAKPPAAATAPVRTQLEYSMTVKGKDGQPFQLAGEMLFPAGYDVALNIRTPQPGYLYVLNDGPMPDGSASINVLYPGSGASARLPAAQLVRIPPQSEFHLDEAGGTEKLYLVWSAKPAPEMESVKDLSPSETSGHVMVTAAPQLAALRRFLSAHQVAASGIGKDEEAKKTLLSSDRDVLVHLIRLEHH